MISYLKLRPAKHLILIALFIGSFMPAVYSHNVVSGTYVEGMMIEGEVGFSSGEMAEAGSSVQVFNTSGDVLAETVLSEGGVFSYQAKTVANHIFKVNLSAGHIAKMVVEADELVAPKVISEAASSKKQVMLAPKQGDLGGAQANNLMAAAASSRVNDLTIEQLQRIVRSAVAQQVKPLQKELRAYKEKVMFRDISGGLGFIFGLFGVAAWMASRRKEGEKDATVS